MKKIILILAFLSSLSAFAENRSFRADAVEIDGTKFWLPSSFTVKKGDKVKIHIVSKVPGPNSVHGFAIDDYKVQEVADTKGKDIEFVADKAGIFPIRCHLHEAHIGGQLIVLE
ncbi:MAG: cupredoxin domain-containing protein [Bdellovibrionota bacterium]